MLVVFLHHLRHGLDAQTLAGGEHALHDGALARAVGDAADIDAVDLHEIDMQLLQIRQ
ncbi:hypothetical protein D3C83_205970 [compost metagenome]